MASEFDPIIAEVAATTRKVIGDAAAVAADASKKADEDKLTAKDLVLSFTKLVDIAVGGGVKITQRLIEDQPSGVAGIADYTRAVGRRMARESQLIAKAANENIQKDAFDVDDWVVSMARWADVAIIGGMEIAQTVLAGPARFDHDALAIAITAAPSEAARGIGPARVTRIGDEAEIPAQLILFDPGQLEAGQRDFRVLVHTYELLSGVYRGVVAVGAEEITFEFAV